jgi:hypothetical protein
MGAYEYGTISPFVAVTGITGVPATATVGTGLTLTGTVSPTTATNQTIVWSISGSDAGTTGASISGGILSTATPGTATVTATITDGTSVGTDYTQDFIITVTAAPVIVITPAITTTALQDGTVGTAYSQTLTATGDAPITWSVISGDLPDGLTLHPVTGAITGTPSTVGTFNFTVQAANGTLPDATRALSITIVVGTNGSINLAFTTFDKNTKNAAYYRDISVTLSPGSYAFTAIRLNDALVDPANYSVSGNTYTLKKEYLATLSVGTREFTFQMSGGVDPVLIVMIEDTTGDTTEPLHAFNGVSVFIKDSGKNLIHTTSMDFKLFGNVWVDGLWVPGSRYMARTGSTVITLYASYLQTLSVGNHTLTVEFTNGKSVTDTFAVKARQNIPQTGDDSDMTGWLIMLFSSVLGILCVVGYRKARQLKGNR